MSIPCKSCGSTEHLACAPLFAEIPCLHKNPPSKSCEQCSNELARLGRLIHILIYDSNFTYTTIQRYVSLTLRDIKKEDPTRL